MAFLSPWTSRLLELSNSFSSLLHFGIIFRVTNGQIFWRKKVFSARFVGPSLGIFFWTESSFLFFVKQRREMINCEVLWIKLYFSLYFFFTFVHPSWILMQWCWFEVRKKSNLFKPLQRMRTIKCSLEWRHRFCRSRHCVSCLSPFCRRVNVHLSDGSLGSSYKAVVYCGQVRQRTRW